MSANIDANFQIVVKTPPFVSRQSVDNFVIQAYPNMLKRLYLKDNNQYFNLRNNFIKILGKKYDLLVKLNESYKSTSKIFDNKIILNLKSLEDKETVIKRLLLKKTKDIVIPLAQEKANLLNLNVKK